MPQAASRQMPNGARAPRGTCLDYSPSVPLDARDPEIVWLVGFRVHRQKLQGLGVSVDVTTDLETDAQAFLFGCRAGVEDLEVVDGHFDNLGDILECDHAFTVGFCLVGQRREPEAGALRPPGRTVLDRLQMCALVDAAAVEHEV